MADEKKPKIDLKARLKKAAADDATPPPGDAGAPAAGSAPAMTPGLPVPPGVPVGPTPALDPSNPLAAVAAPRPVAAAPQQTQRIEVDEMQVQEAASKARKTMGVFAFFTLLLGAGAGYVGGQASESNNSRQKSKQDAAELKIDVDKAKAQLQDLMAKLKDGQGKLGAKEGRSFPKDLANQLGGINVDFDGQKLAGRRFSGFATDTATQLVEFVTAIQTLSDHKNAVKNLLTKLEKPLTDQLNADPSKGTVAQMVLLGRQDPQKNFYAILAPVTPPLQIEVANIVMPDEMKGVDPTSAQNVSVPRYKSGDLNKPAAIYVLPKSFDAVCPAETKSQAAQLAVKLADLIHEIEGDPVDPDSQVVADSKPGLLERADRLSKGLEKVGAK